MAQRKVTRLCLCDPPLAGFAQTHKALRTAVAVDCGWADCAPAMVHDEILRGLLALNLERSANANG